MKIRFPNNAGSWYAGTDRQLRTQLEQECFFHKLGPGRSPKPARDGPRKIIGLLCPHAGYQYSGSVAAHSYLALADDGRPKTSVIIGPNHTGMGSGASIMIDGVWRTPLGDVPINTYLAKAIQKASKYIDIDEEAHRYEHSIELQLPFLQYSLASDFDFVPISIMLQDLDVALDIARAVSESLRDVDAVIIASSDMTHYEPQTVAYEKDMRAVEAIKNLDGQRLIEIVETLNISMCGAMPAGVMVMASKILGAHRGVLLKYATSGDVTMDKRSVVGYCSMVLSKD